MFWKKKVNLAWVLKAEELKPIPEDHATTVMAFLEAGGIPVTAGAEAAAKITELKDSVKQVEGDLAATKITLRTAPDMATLAIGRLRTELKKLIEATQATVRLRAKRISRVRDAIIAWVDGATEAIIDRARIRGSVKENRMELKFSARIAQVEADLKAELASLRDSVSQLEAESFATRLEINNLEPMAKKWTLPVKK